MSTLTNYIIMKNLFIILTLIFSVSIFSSCTKEECETCTYAFAYTDADMVDEAAPEGWDADYAAVEHCDDALTDAKAAWVDVVVEDADAVDAVEDDLSTPDVDETVVGSDAVDGHTITMTCAAVE